MESAKGSRTTYTNIDAPPHDPRELPPPQPQVIGRRHYVEHLSRRAVEHGERGIVGRHNVVDLGVDDALPHVGRQAGLQRRLRPVDAKVPVARPLVQAFVLFENGARDAGL